MEEDGYTNWRKINPPNPSHYLKTTLTLKQRLTPRWSGV